MSRDNIIGLDRVFIWNDDNRLLKIENGARYRDPPMMTGEYLPKPPISKEAKKYNSKLPGMGGVFNSVNLSVYHYAGLNPVKLMDPDGNATKQSKEFIGNRVNKEYEVKATIATVEKNDTLWSIANSSLQDDIGNKKVSNRSISDRVKLIAKGNSIKNPNLIKLGQKLVIVYQ